MSGNSITIIGCGTLGSRVGALLHSSGKSIYGETGTTSKHSTLQSLGIIPYTRDKRGVATGSKGVAQVVFCAPPSITPPDNTYADELKLALDQVWNRDAPDSKFVFTSSSGVYGEDNGGIVNEATEVTNTARAQRLLDAERVVLEAGGIVLRLAGLYTMARGPHGFWYKSPNPPTRNANGLINLVHYEDAARAIVTVLQSETVPSSVYLVADGYPITRQEISNAASQLPIEPFNTVSEPVQFPVLESRKGKRIDATLIKKELKWEPQFQSFQDFAQKMRCLHENQEPLPEYL
eukprot:m.28374 g.28374  ORF g.28374 m.28374 type:complete len:292 (-) comp7998_c0_seq2:59-934(-)